MKLYSYEQEHIGILRKLAAECMVLLKCDSSFPLQSPGKIALYGSGARRTIKGGTGSGDVNVRHYVTVEEGLENAGFTITTKAWMDAYEVICQEAHKKFVAGIKEKAKADGVPAIILGMGAVMPEPDYELPLDGTGETAVYVLARISGEGSDRQAAAGDFRLTQTEIRDILRLSEQYERFMLVLNVGGVIDLTPILKVKNILLLSQTGMTIGDSFTDVLLGKSYPSGKLTSTWAAWEDYCHIGDFGEQDDTRYKEGIYVGYRYFDTVGKEPLFPFGYGLGYTTFSMEMPEISLSGSVVTVRTEVKNTGNATGKEVVQLYVSVPSGRLDQPYQALAAFAKTEELKAGEKETVTLTFDMEELVSFDTEQSASILEAGDYILRLGSSSRDTKACGLIRLEHEILKKHLQHAGGDADFEDWKPQAQEICRGSGDYALEKENEVYSSLPTLVISKAAAEAGKPQEKKLTAESKVGQGTESETESRIAKFLDSLTDKELAYLCIGGFKEKGSESVIGNAGTVVAGSAGETTRRYVEQGIPPLIMADGPAGLRLSRQYGVDGQGVYAIGDEIPAAVLDFVDEQLLAAFGKQDTEKSERNGEIFDQYCSAIPIGTALAQSWNIGLCEKCGDLVGEEMERFGVHLWLAPALNIHRSPLCGRNFEYYSEDPLISGKMAAAVTRGVQKHPGCGVTIKHFACNNQETNRFHSNSIVSERTLRDIYLRGFRIVVQEAEPYAVMTSYNLLNGEHTSQRRDLNTGVLREEWGFQGIVMSDWVTAGLAAGMTFKYPYACASGSIQAGNDLMMPGGEADHADLMKGLSDPEHAYPLTRKDLEECAARVCRLAWKLAGQ